MYILIVMRMMLLVMMLWMSGSAECGEEDGKRIRKQQSTMRTTKNGKRKEHSASFLFFYLLFALGLYLHAYAHCMHTHQYRYIRIWVRGKMCLHANPSKEEKNAMAIAQNIL